MRIVHVVRQFHPAVGGLENFVKDLAAEQLRAGHAVRIVTLDRVFNAPKRARLSPRETIAGIAIVRIPFFGSTRYPIAPSVIRHLGDADIVHVHGIDFLFDFLALMRPFHRRKLVVSSHGGFFHTQFIANIKRLYFNTITRLALSRYAAVATVSAADDALFRTIRSRGLTLIENGVDIAKYFDASSRTPRKTMLAMGRLSGNKRLDRAIGFLAALRRLDPQWSLCIAGRPWDVSVAALQRLAADLGVADAVKIVANPSDAGLREIMAEVSVLVSASDYEGFGLAVVEGLSAGLWPVLSPIGPFRHLVEKTGLGAIVDFSDPEAAARDFLAAWTPVAAAHAHVRKAAIIAAGDYDWSTTAAKYEALYQSVLGTKVRCILDVPILVRTSSEAVELLDAHFGRGAPVTVIFANAHTLNTTVGDRKARATLSRSIVFNDGVGIDIASRLLFGKSFPDNLNGTDFIPHYLRQTRNRYRIFLLGGRPGIAEQAGMQLARLAPDHEIAGCCHGYTAGDGVADVIEQIRQSRADVLLVAMGNPIQERWLNDHLKDTGCRLGFGVGGLFDFLAGAATRAPAWMRAARIEWAYRLVQEPKRFWRRYLVEMPVFLLRVSRQWLTGARVSSAMPQ